MISENKTVLESIIDYKKSNKLEKTILGNFEWNLNLKENSKNLKMKKLYEEQKNQNIWSSDYIFKEII